MKDFIKRLSSRKFLIVVFGIAAVTQYPQFAGDIIKLVAIYVAGEGLPDLAQRYASEKTKQTSIATNATLLANGIPDGFAAAANPQRGITPGQ